MHPLARPRFLTAEWRKLIMAQYKVVPEVLAPYLPAGVELDLYAGRCFVSLVGFLFDRVRVKGLAFPCHTRFPEVNLRFYVKRTELNGELRRGVVFVNEFVPRRAIALIAKRFYEEPYVAMPMGYSIAEREGALAVNFRWHMARRKHVVSAAADAQPVAIQPGSLEEFITEHYWGYTKRTDGSTSVYQVEHPRWQVYPVHACTVECDFAALYGERWEFLNRTQPAHVLLAEGSPVTVYGGAPLRA